MKHYERRELNAYPFFKVAVWDERSCTWRDGKKSFASEQAAVASVPSGTKARLSRVEDGGRRLDLAPFVS